MLRPSYTELMEKLNREQNMDGKITSRYTIVIASAKRARQIIDGANPQTYAPTDRAVSTAIKEMYEGRLKITSSDEDGAAMLGSVQYGDDEAPGSYQNKLKYTMLRDEKEQEEEFDLDSEEDEFIDEPDYENEPVYDNESTKDDYDDYEEDDQDRDRDYDDEIMLNDLDENNDSELEDDYS